METTPDPFGAKDVLDTDGSAVGMYRIHRLEELGIGNISRLPYSIKILLESLLRHLGGQHVTEEDVRTLARWEPNALPKHDIPFIPSRVLLQDFTGVPVVVDLAAMRSAMQRSGADYSLINPVIPTDLVIDHSIQVDYYGTSYARTYNEKKEFERNRKRYAFLRWAQKAFDNVQVIPPGRGIVHQVNLEYLASVVNFKKVDKELVAFPDTLVGTDSHTTMINGLGVLGWGVGGIEAESVMLGQPYYMPIPDVVGVKLFGELQAGVTATDLVLTLTHLLREYGVVGKFVEFFGSGIRSLSLPDRATVANMAPEYGATVGFFPIDEQTLHYLALTGRKRQQIDLVRLYAQKQGLFFTHEAPEPLFSDTLELDMSTVHPSLAGPKRPQDLIPLNEMARRFHTTIAAPNRKADGELNRDPHYHRWLEEGGNHIDRCVPAPEDEYIHNEKHVSLTHGSIVIAAITSCTNTSNPSVLIGAGLLAKKAVEHGLKVKSFVKTSLAPGSRVVTEYLTASGLLPYLEALGFHLVGYGCTTCIGNSGPLAEHIVKEVKENDLTIAAVLSGNRNFEGRIHPLVKANYLASPLLVVAYAIAGTVSINLTNEPLGYDPNGLPVYIQDIWPTQDEVQQVIHTTLNHEMFAQHYSKVLEGTQLWSNLDIPEGKLYEWDPDSTYIQEPPFFIDFPLDVAEMGDIIGGRVLALLGDSITTDHISPAGTIPATDPAGAYLISQGIDTKDFNSYGSRRGNHEVMVRGTFANIRLRNQLVTGREGGWTIYYPTREEMTIYDAAMRYMKSTTPVIVLAGKEYGTGSSRDWAAKGTCLLGVKAVIAESFERIHRSNLVGMGVLPLQFKEGENPDRLGLKGNERYDILGIASIQSRGEVNVVARGEHGSETRFNVTVRLDSALEVKYFHNGGILHTFLREMLHQ